MRDFNCMDCKIQQGRGILRPVLLFSALIFAFFMTINVALAAQKVRIDVPAVIYLPDSDVAFKLGDVAKFNGPRKVVDKLSSLILSVNKKSGSKNASKTRTLSQEQVLNAIETSGLDDLQIELHMPKTVKIERPAAVGNQTVVPSNMPSDMPDNQGIAGFGVNDLNDDLNFMVKSLAGWDGGVEVTASSTIPPGRLIRPASIVPGTAAATLQFQDDAGRVRSLAIRMTWTQDVIMAARPISRNTTIRREDLMIRSMRITKAGEYATRFDQVVGHVSRKDFAQASPIRLDLLTSATLLKKGRKVQIIARVNGLVVKTDGTLLEDGSVGDMVRVRRSGAAYRKTELRAVIINENTVEIQVD